MSQPRAVKVIQVVRNKITTGERYRKDFNNIELEKLAASIKKNGLLNPIDLTEDYLLIAGERRLRAMDILGWKKIPSQIHQVSSTLALRELEFTENNEREDFTWQEKALSIQGLHLLYQKKKPSWTQQQTATRLHLSTGGVSTAITLAKLIKTFPSIKEAKTEKEAQDIATQLKDFKKKQAEENAIALMEAKSPAPKEKEPEKEPDKPIVSSRKASFISESLLPLDQKDLGLNFNLPELKPHSVIILNIKDPIYNRKVIRELTYLKATNFIILSFTSLYNINMELPSELHTMSHPLIYKILPYNCDLINITRGFCWIRYSKDFPNIDWGAYIDMPYEDFQTNLLSEITQKHDEAECFIFSDSPISSIQASYKSGLQTKAFIHPNNIPLITKECLKIL